MITLYISPSCSSCRKVKKYFDENGIKYQEKNILQTKLLRSDIFKMLSMSEHGFADIISTKSKVFKDTNLDLKNMTIHQLVDFIIENPTILKRPIIINDMDLQVGYNPDDITLFLPPELRTCLECSPDDSCEYVKNIKIDKDN